MIRGRKKYAKEKENVCKIEKISDIYDYDYGDINSNNSNNDNCKSNI